MANFNFYSLLLIVCCVASTIEAHSIPLAESFSTFASEREAKNLLLFPFQPIQPHGYGPQSRYGFGSRQTNSPISPAIAQNGLGPFFGYFPNLLTQPCPAAEKCAECPTNNSSTTTDAPVSTTTAAPVSTCSSLTKSTKVCPDNKKIYQVGSDGTFDIDNAATAATLNCGVVFVSIYDDKKIELKCTNIESNVKMFFYTTVTPADSNVVQGTAYTSNSNSLELSINNFPDKTKNLKFSCSWKSV